MLDRRLLATLAVVTFPLTTGVSTPAPAASPPAPLKTIANVRSTPRCSDIVTHANNAINAALNNDMVLGQTVTRLRAINLDDGNPIHRRNGLNALGDLAKTLMIQARSGDDEVKRLRKLAKTSTDPQEAVDLKAFADEIGGALWRQQRIARDLNGYLASIDFRDMAKFDDGQQQMNVALFGVADPIEDPMQVQLSGPIAPYRWEPPNGTYMLGHDPTDPTATQEAQAAAKDFQDRESGIAVDEGQAASHVDGALKNC
ncbi:MAG: hypothetical protein JOZ01_03820 [Candidatus Eremiobacteraeota bacterium]|nr:hypothetical protein [Candidatus Eremiobacteraeota bacterium]